ncbi:ligase-associated DNA damage response exonuclease [Gemmobacter fulvus]|uniref:Ligase-associated DNA damage response exonuclease n=1 Tax=Gemmobacter fulvus TaxID=2840474 RepID=A0A975P944_9RHOB|nr:ligase-associated DNA damage response exonuclease [Gemmobacter fulvus]MBT9244396.1 ligase-associated DNA damage response exonuclease [Gemmobacter fulvus]QWK91273.1 ligase-associated DNA damage response exonuclease [Gemmobacter fulvus]
MPTAPLLTFTDKGIYCAEGDFFIDPWRPVPRAVITHAHSDHARPGHGQYLCTIGTAPVMQHRLGEIAVQTAAYGEAVQINGIRVSFHPAGHLPGSAQVRLERGGEVWVVSGDYKVEPDGLAEPFEPVPCHAFITETTFGLPVFRWQNQEAVAAQIMGWWAQNAREGRVSVIGAYALGKAQRLMAALTPIGPILTHGAVEATTRILRQQGYALPETLHATGDVSGKTHPGALVIAPPSALGSAWAARFGPRSEAFASGWMAIRGIRRRRGNATGFVLSDHADWPGLNTAIRATGASRVFVTHGYTSAFCTWLLEQGYDAQIVATPMPPSADTEDGAA